MYLKLLPCFPKTWRRLLNRVLMANRQERTVLVMNIHLKPIADIVSPVLASLYTGMPRNAYIPMKLKEIVLITLHKGGRNRVIQTATKQ